MVNYCLSICRKVIFAAGILMLLGVLCSCKKSDDDSIPVSKLGDYYSMEWLATFETNEFISKTPLLKIDNLNRIFLCYNSNEGLKALVIDSLGNSSELVISENFTEYFQGAFFSQQNTPYFCTNESVIKYEDSQCTSYFPPESDNTHVVMANMNPADGSLWVATRFGLYTSEDGTDFNLVKSHEELLGERYHMYPAQQSWDRDKMMVWHNNTLYYLIMGELWTYYNGDWIRLNDALKNSVPYISDFCLDSHDVIWATMIGGSGLLKLDGADVKYFPFPSIFNPWGGSISDPAYNSGSSSIYSTNLEIDTGGRIWMSLSSGGLIMFSENRWYTLTSGLEGINSLSLSKSLFITVDNKEQVIFGHTDYLSVGIIKKK